MSLKNKAHRRKAQSLLNRYAKLDEEFIKFTEQVHPLAFLTENKKTCLSNWIHRFDQREANKKKASEGAG